MSDFIEFRDHALQDPGIAKGYYQQKETLKIGRCLGQLLQRARIHKNLSQSNVAEHAGIQQSEVSRIEAGGSAKGPTFETLVRYAHSVGMNLAVELVEGDGEMEKEFPAGTAHQPLRVIF